MCWLCRATGTEGHEHSHGRCDRDAPCKSTRVTHESWRSLLLDNGQELPSSFRNTRGLRIESTVTDSLHTTELGITARVLGNIFQLCINARVFGATVDANVKNSASDRDAWEKRERTPNRNNAKLTKDRICSTNSWPKAHTKGAIARCLLPAPVRSGIGAAASGTSGAIGLSVAGAVLHSAGFGRTVLVASRDAGAGSSLLQKILESRGSSDGETEALEGDAQAGPFFAPLRVAVRVAG